jgi:hypothetical protein
MWQRYLIGLPVFFLHMARAKLRKSRADDTDKKPH